MVVKHIDWPQLFKLVYSKVLKTRSSKVIYYLIYEELRQVKVLVYQSLILLNKLNSPHGIIT